MGDNLDKVFVELNWSNNSRKDSRLEWALDHFDKDKTQLMIFHDSYYNYNEQGYQNITKSYYLPRCAEKNFRVEVLIPAADEVGGDYAANLRKAITRHGINKLITYSFGIRKNEISKMFNEAPHLFCKVWFTEWSGGNAKLESTRYFGPRKDEKITEAPVECENLKKMVKDETSRREEVEEELLILKKTVEDETSRRVKVEEELHTLKKTVKDETNRRQKVEEELLILKKTVEDETSRREKVEDELLMLAETERGFMNLYEFSCTELKEATNNFSDEYKIGEGGYGSVYKGVVHCTIVAIKVLNKKSDQGEKDFNQEIETLQKVRHPYLVSLIGACRENWALVYEFLPKGNLEDCLGNVEHKKSLSWIKRIRIASNICSALVFLHHTKPHGIVHGDLKPANILLDSAYTCKLSDFGTCRPLNLTNTTVSPYHKTNDQRGTLCYFDPEYIASGRITPQSDVFAFGVVLLQLVTGRKAVAIKMLIEEALEDKKLDEVVDSLANWPLEVAEKIARLGLRCIQWSRKDRPDLEKEVWVMIKSMESLDASL